MQVRTAVIVAPGIFEGKHEGGFAGAPRTVNENGVVNSDADINGS